MKKLMKARKVSKQLLELLSPKSYEIHSRFNHGFNLKLDDKLSFIGVGNINMPPLGVVLEHGVDNDFIDLSDDKIYWDHKLKKLESNEIIIDLSKADINDNRLMCKPESIPLDNLGMMLEFVDYNIMTGFGHTIGDLYSLEMEFIRDLCSKFNNLNPLDVEKTLRLWIGRGMGLTPSGDDFLQGLLFTNEIVPILGHVFNEELKKLISLGGLTTDISINYYRCAFSKMYSSTLIELYDTIESGNPKEMRRCIYELLELGNTSGADILSGILTGISFLLNI